MLDGIGGRQEDREEAEGGWEREAGLKGDGRLRGRQRLLEGARKSR